MEPLKAFSVGLANCAVLTAELMVILSCIALKMEAAYSSEMFVHLSVRTAAYQAKLNCLYFEVLYCVVLKFDNLT